MSPDAYLLLIGLGPVQDFIRTARRCRDYWYGSRLLSDLAKTAAREVERCHGEGELIFPPGVPSHSDTAVANKVLARVPDAATARALGERAREAVRAAVLDRWQHLVEGIDKEHHAMLLDARGRAQIDDLIELQWVAVPIGDDYRAARARAEALLSARKSTRDWQAPSWDQPYGVSKSSLDGAREQVLDERRRDTWARRQPWKLRDVFDLQPQESLCGPGLLKRLGVPVEPDAGADDEAYRHFHSTSHVAAAPLLTRLARLPASDALPTYRRALKQAGIAPERLRVRLTDSRDASGAVIRPRVRAPEGDAVAHPPRVFQLRGDEGDEGYDGSLFFEGRLPSLFEECPTKKTRERVEGLASPRARREALRGSIDDATAALRACLAALGVRGAPCPYFAFLLADGDHMGAAFEAVTGGDVEADIAAHRALAERLNAFAAEARQVVIRHCGSPIYAGGDDVSALLPLHTALACARALRDTFDRLVAHDLPASARPTLSAGLAIVHHLTAMSDARALAEDAEQMAKDPARGGRNALAIIADKRSGARLEVYGKWDASAPDAPSADWGLDRRLATWCRLYRQGELPHKAAFELEALLRPFEIAPPPPGAAGDETRRATRAAVRRLAERVIRRRRLHRDAGAQPLDRSVEAWLTDRIGGDAITDVRRLSGELQVARVMLKALEDAWGPGPGEEAE